MAKRICFISSPSTFPMFDEVEIEFQYYNGFAISQKQKSILSMHSAIKKTVPGCDILEVSTKSNNSIGVALSAFNLKYPCETFGKDYPLENIFQSSKVFKNGGPYRDIIDMNPRDAKRDIRLKNSGDLLYFDLNGTRWELEPKSMFYDWLYIYSLYQDQNLSKRIMDFNTFTDIEFNQEKSVNCQARSAAIFVSLSKNGLLPSILQDLPGFRRIYPENRRERYQTSFLN